MAGVAGTAAGRAGPWHAAVTSPAPTTSAIQPERIRPVHHSRSAKSYRNYESVPDLPAGFQLVLREIDRFLATRKPPAGSALTHLRPDRRAALRQRLAAGLSGPVPRLGEWLERAPYGSNAAPPGATSGRY